MPTCNSRVKTIISGRRDVLNRLPSKFVGTTEKLLHTGDMEFTELEMNGSNIRLRIAEYLHNSGWKLMNSDLSSSAGYDSKSMISSLIIEQSYRDRWFLPQEEFPAKCESNGAAAHSSMTSSMDEFMSPVKMPRNNHTDH